MNICTFFEIEFDVVRNLEFSKLNVEQKFNIEMEIAVNWGKFSSLIVILDRNVLTTTLQNQFLAKEILQIIAFNSTSFEPIGRKVEYRSRKQSS